MTNITVNDAAPAQSSLAAAFAHARYVLSDNPVTGFAFGLFMLIVVAAAIGPYIVPYDPLASDTAAALQAVVQRQAGPPSHAVTALASRGAPSRWCSSRCS